MAATKACRVTRKQFRSAAKPVVLMIGDQKLVLDPKEFQTGSLGWNFSGKVFLRLGNDDVTAQCGVNLTIVNSKGAVEG
jgi:hypothetical protein